MAIAHDETTRTPDGGAAEFDRVAKAPDGADDALDGKGATTFGVGLSVVNGVVTVGRGLGCSVGVES